MNSALRGLRTAALKGVTLKIAGFPGTGHTVRQVPRLGRDSACLRLNSSRSRMGRNPAFVVVQLGGVACPQEEHFGSAQRG